MPTKPVSKLKPYNSGKWTKARFFGFIRSALRRASVKWAPIQQAKKDVRRPYVGPNVRQKFEYQCSGCRKWFKGTETQVDHIEPCGTLKDFSDIEAFVRRLFCEVDGLRVLCLTCHKERP